MAEKTRDQLLFVAAPSRLISFHYYLLVALLAGLSASMSLGFLQFNLPTILGYDLNLWLPLGMAVLSILLFFYAELRRITQRYMVYENRVARREGILSRKIQYMSYNKVQRLELNQSIAKRIFGIGDIHIDTGEDSIVFQSVRNPSRVEALVSERLSAHEPTSLDSD